jgi:hypothetical protein
MTISETEGVLYTRGTVDFYKTYPGMYVPAPLRSPSTSRIHRSRVCATRSWG